MGIAWRRKIGGIQSFPFLPQEISGARCVVDVTIPSSFGVVGGGSLVDGSEINSWADQSGNGHNFLQSVATTYPIYRANSGGFPALDFDGSNDNMIMTLSAQIAQPFTVLVVGSMDVTGGGKAFCDGINVTNRHFLRDSAGTWQFTPGSGAISVSTVAQDTSTHIFLATSNNASSIIRVDGALHNTGAGPGTPTDGFRIGSNYLPSGAYLDGKIRAFALFNRLLTDQEVALLEEYYGNKFNFPVGKDRYIYVDTVTGNDSTKAGNTALNPLRTVNAALTKIGASNSGTISINAPSTNPVREILQITGNRQISIVSSTSNFFYWYGATRYTSGWTLVSGTTYSLAHTYSGVNNVIIRGIPETYGDVVWPDFRPPKNTTTPTTPNPGEFGISGTTIYLNTGGADPNLLTIDIDLDYACIVSRANQFVCVNKAHLEMGASACITTGVGAGDGSTWIQDSECYYSYFGGVHTQGVAPYIGCLRVTSQRNANDGFNLNGTAGLNNLMEIWDCNGSYNGDEGASPHNDTVMKIYNSIFNYCGSGGFAATDSSTFHLSNCRFSDNQLTNQISSEGGIGQLMSTCGGTITNCVVKRSRGRNLRIVNPSLVTLTNVVSMDGGLPDLL